MTTQAKGFRDGERHGWLDSWCGLIARIIHGRQAQQALEEGLPGDVAVAALPVWAWARPVTSVGRKGRARDGGVLLLPVRVDWSPTALAIVPAGSEGEYEFTAAGLGIEQRGRSVLSATGGAGFSAANLDLGIRPLERSVLPVLTAESAGRELARIAEDGTTALWEAVTSLETFIERAVLRAHTYISGDVDSGPLLDPGGLERVRDNLLFGAEGGSGPSSVMRIINRATDPTQFIRVDPQRWLTVELHRDAQQEVRRQVGDPATGSKIRRVARQVGVHRVTSPADIDRVVAACAVAHPRDRIGRGRVAAALSVGPDAMAAAVPLSRWRASGEVGE